MERLDSPCCNENGCVKGTTPEISRGSRKQEAERKGHQSQQWRQMMPHTLNNRNKPKSRIQTKDKHNYLYSTTVVKAAEKVRILLRLQL